MHGRLALLPEFFISRKTAPPPQEPVRRLEEEVEVLATMIYQCGRTSTFRAVIG